jgi:hypothetical protein
MNDTTSEALRLLALIGAIFTLTANAATQYTITESA